MQTDVLGITVISKKTDEKSNWVAFVGFCRTLNSLM